MISNGSNVLLTQNTGTLPDVNDALMGWFQPMTFATTVKTVVNYQVVETKTSYTFQGVWQPFTDQQLLMRPEGQRSWSWFEVHADPSLSLIPDQLITYQSVQYRVMSKTDYTIYGYILYSLANDYTGSGPS